MTSPLPAALAIPLLALAGVAHSGPDQIPVHPAAISAPATKARTAEAQPVSRPVSKKQVEALDLGAPNFLSPRWQERLQGPTIDHSLDYMPMEFVVVTPGLEGSNTRVAPVGIGSVYWAATHPAQAWRVLMPVQEGDEFDTDREVALAYNDVQSDCPGFPGTPNVRPICP